MLLSTLLSLTLVQQSAVASEQARAFAIFAHPACTEASRMGTMFLLRRTKRDGTSETLMKTVVLQRQKPWVGLAGEGKIAYNAKGRTTGLSSRLYDMGFLESRYGPRPPTLYAQGEWAAKDKAEGPLEGITEMHWTRPMKVSLPWETTYRLDPMEVVAFEGVDRFDGSWVVPSPFDGIEAKNPLGRKPSPHVPLYNRYRLTAPVPKRLYFQGEVQPFVVQTLFSVVEGPLGQAPPSPAGAIIRRPSGSVAAITKMPWIEFSPGMMRMMGLTVEITSKVPVDEFPMISGGLLVPIRVTVAEAKAALEGVGS